MPLALLEGAVVGLSVAAPIGPVSLVCVQRSLLTGPSGGIASGLGAATVHGCFALLALLGAGMLAFTLQEWHHAIRLGSAAVMITLGLRMVFRRAAAGPAVAGRSLGAAYLSTALLALSNPMTILPYLAIASGTVPDGSRAISGSLWAAPGVMLGAMACYTVLSLGAALLRERLGRAFRSRLNVISGVCLVGFGILIGLG